MLPGLILLSIFFVITLRNFRYGLFIFLASLPAYLVRFKIFGLPTTMLELLFWILFAVWIYNNVILNPFQGLAKRFRGKFGIETVVPIGLFFASSIVAIFISPGWWQALGVWRAYFLEPILFFVILLTTVRNEDDFDWAVWPLIISVFYISLYAFAQRFLGLPIITPWQAELRVTSLFDYPNAVGLFIAPILPFVLVQAIKYFKFRASKMKLAEAVILCVIFALGIGAIILAKSDGAFIGLAAGLAVFGLIYNRKTRLAVAIAIMAVSVAILVIPGVGQKVANQFLLGDWSGYVRQTIWSETWQMLKDNPLFGAGLAGYQTVFAPYHLSRGIEIFMYPHNIFFNFWSEVGMLGLVALVWLVIMFFKKLIMEFKFLISEPFATAALSAMIIILVHGLVDVPYFKNDLSFLFWIIIAMPFILPKSEKSGKMGK